MGGKRSLEKRQYQLGSPCLDKLIGYIAKPHPYIAQERNLQVINARELIFSDPGVLACVHEQDKDTLLVIVKKTEYRKMEMTLKAKNLKLSTQNIVSPQMYQECFAYSLIARLCPDWNKVGDDLLVYGSTFLTSRVNNKLNAIELQVDVNYSQINLTVAPACVKLPPMNVEKLNVNYNEMQQFLNKDNNKKALTKIDEFHSQNTCHALPRLKKCSVVSVIRDMPRDVFEDYQGLANYWMNTYGYKLPDTSDGMLFYEINFGSRFGKSSNFVYPDVCLSPRPLSYVQLTDEQEILDLFFSFCSSNMPAACGEVMKYAGQALYPTGGLTSASQFTNSSLANLATAKPQVNYMLLAAMTQPGTQHTMTSDELVRFIATDTAGGAGVLGGGGNPCVSQKPPTEVFSGPKVVPFFKDGRKVGGRTKQEARSTTGGSFPKALKYSQEPVLAGTSTVAPPVESADSNNNAVEPIVGESVNKKAAVKKQAVKKPRDENTPKSEPKKPKIAEGVDMVEAALTDQWTKINVATLKKWLSDRGIKTTSKETKTILIEKVVNSLTSSGEINP